MDHSIIKQLQLENESLKLTNKKLKARYDISMAELLKVSDTVTALTNAKDKHIATSNSLQQQLQLLETKNEALRTDNQEKQLAVDKLRAEMQQLQTSSNDALTYQASQEQRFECLNNELAEYKQQYNDQQQQAKQMENNYIARITNLETEAKQSRAQIDMLKIENKSFSKTMDCLEDELQEAKRELTTNIKLQQEETEQHRVATEIYNTKLHEQQHDLAQLNANNVRLLQQITSLTNEVEALTAELFDCSEHSGKEIEQLNYQLQSANSSLKSLKTKLHAKDVQLSRLQDNISSLSNSLNTSKNDADVHLQTITSLKVSLESSQEALATAQLRLKERTTQLEQAKEKVTETQLMNDILERKLQETQTQYATKVEELTTATKAHQLKFTQASQLVESKDEHIKLALQQVSEIEEDNERLLAQLSSLTDANNAANLSLRTTQRATINMEQTIDKLQNKILSLKQENSAATALHATALEALATQNAALEEQLQNASQQLEQRTRKLEKVDIEKTQLTTKMEQQHSQLAEMQTLLNQHEHMAAITTTDASKQMELVCQLKKQNFELNCDIQHQTKQIQALTKKLNETNALQKSKISILKSEKAASKKVIDNLKIAVAAADKQQSAVLFAKDQLQMDCDDLNILVVNLEEKINELELRNPQQQKNLATAKTKLAQVEQKAIADHKQLLATICKLETVVANKQVELGNASNEQTQLLLRIEGLTTSNCNLMLDAERHTAQCSMMNEQLAEFNKRVASLQMEVNNLQTTISTKQQLLAKKESDLQAKDEELVTINDKAHQLEEKLKAMTTRIGAVETENSTLRANIARLELDLSSQLTKENSLLAKLNVSTNNETKLIKQLELLNKANEEVQNDTTYLTAKLNDITKECNQLKQHNELISKNLQSSTTSEKQQRQLVYQVTECAELERNKLLQQLSTYSKANAQLKQSLVAGDARIAERNVYVDSLQNQLQQATASISQLQSSNDALLDSLQQKEYLANNLLQDNNQLKVEVTALKQATTNIAQLQSKVRELESSLVSNSADNKQVVTRLREKIEALKEAARQMVAKEELSTASDKLLLLEKELECNEEELSKVHAAHYSLATENKSLAKQLLQLEGEVARLKEKEEKLNELYEAQDKLLTENEVLTNQLQEQVECMEEKEEELNELYEAQDKLLTENKVLAKRLCATSTKLSVLSNKLLTNPSRSNTTATTTTAVPKIKSKTFDDQLKDKENIICSSKPTSTHRQALAELL